MQEDVLTLFIHVITCTENSFLTVDAFSYMYVYDLNNILNHLSHIYSNFDCSKKHNTPNSATFQKKKVLVKINIGEGRGSKHVLVLGGGYYP